MTPDPIVLAAGLNQNFQLFRGEDKVLLIDLAGYDLITAMALEWWLARSPYSLDDPLEVYIKKTLTAGIVVGGTDIEITIAAADTAAIKPDIYYHELKLTQSNAAVKVIMTGNVTIQMALNMEGIST
jgi:hypothetical protein